MRGIILKDSIKLFGFKDGLGFWFRWNFSDPIKIFYWKYVAGRPLCTKHDFLCKPDCKAEKIYGRKNIIKYEKERHKQIEKESKTIRGSENGICVYCGEEKGTEIIDDPNLDTLERWLVCNTCKELINHQRDYSLGKILTTKKDFNLRNLGLKISKEAKKNIKKIEEETGKKSFSLEISGENIEV